MRALRRAVGEEKARPEDRCEGCDGLSRTRIGDRSVTHLLSANGL